MTEIELAQIKKPKTSYPKLFEDIRKNLPDRSRGDFNGGVSAAIRRLDPETQFGNAALVRVLVNGGVSTGALHQPEQAQAWATVAQALAIMAHAGLRSGPAAVGAVLGELALSDNRLARLLTARGEAFRAQALRTVRLIAAQGKSANLDYLLELMLIEGKPERGERAETLRLYIVADFEHAMQKANKSVA